MTSLRQAPTDAEILENVREGVEAIVRDALAEAERLNEQADEKLETYDATTAELATLRLEVHGLRHEVDELPSRVHLATLD